MSYKNHYEYLEANLKTFFEKVGVSWGGYAVYPIIVAHGDKCYGYSSEWEEIGLHFYHGVTIFLLTYVRPFCDEVRDTAKGWVDVNAWIMENKDRFLPFLPPVED